MSTASLPGPIQEFIDATNSGDTERFVAAFSEDAYLNDWGREFSGRDGVRSWDRTDNIGKQTHFEVVAIAPGAQDGSYAVTVNVTGNGFNGTGPLDFVVRDGSIAELRIS
ncbi:nuclear transport factor 2 family protein [Paramicrobacterium fandaimingii]|uniref:nuclear transport factor 2 family protein n=1 Tax=Paramicrobacterium fandaimingii TaxID=2708079 RepID=UPI00142448DF|nr:nuclear transport factor 2 family protein [Microbacterium fandaimingii]